MAPPLPQDGMNLHFKNPEPHLSIVTTGVTLNQVELSDEALHLINLNLLVAQKLKRFTCQRYGKRPAIRMIMRYEDPPVDF